MKFVKGFTHLAQFGVLATLSNSAFALGLYIPFQSAADIGDGRAGNAAVVRDASTNYFNPAGLVLFQHPQLVISDVGVLAHYNYNGTMSNPGLGSPTFEKGHPSSTPRGLVPAFHYVYPLTKELAAGVSLVVPSGLGFEYAPDSVLRYEAVSTMQSSASLSPSIGYRVNSQFSVGVGGDALFTYARSSVMARTQPFTFKDSEAKNTVSGLDFGWHGGLLYQFTPHTRVGLAYHSQIILNLFGESRFYSNGPFLPSTVSSQFRATIPLASLTNISLYHDMTSRWAMLGSIEYMNWHIYKYDHAYNLASPAGPVTVTLPRRLHDTWYFAVGSSYQLSNQWLLRGGIDYARGSTVNANRLITLTDNNEIDLNFGIHCQATPTIGLDVGANYGLIKNVTINSTNPITRNHLSGRVTGTGETLGAQLTWDMV